MAPANATTRAKSPHFGMDETAQAGDLAISRQESRIQPRGPAPFQQGQRGRNKAAVKPRFVQWVKDICESPFDQAWLDYQQEIALRHTLEKKNRTDGRQTPPVVPLRYILAFAPPVLAAGHARLAKYQDAGSMQTAWTKAVMLTLALWARPFARDGLW